MSETVRLLPPGIDLGATDEPIKADAWKNIDFLKDGTSFVCDMVHPSEEEARQISDNWNAETEAIHRQSIADGRKGVVVTDLDDVAVYLWEDYSHTLQVPWNKP
jgi:hypothetical protein